MKNVNGKANGRAPNSTKIFTNEEKLKQQLKEARLKLREEKRKIKEAKAKLWEIVPNKSLPEITFNPILASNQ